MKLRLWLALTACIVGASAIPATAAADPPEQEEFSPVGDRFLCGETLLTVESGTIVIREHEHELKSGLFRVILVSLTKGVTATDEEGVVYRVVGPVHANFTTPPEGEPGEEIGFLHEKLSFIGPGGLFGTLDLRLRAKRNGDEVELDKGTCRLVGDEEEEP
jgi:hypothetical protein